MLRNSSDVLMVMVTVRASTSQTCWEDWMRYYVITVTMLKLKSSPRLMIGGNQSSCCGKKTLKVMHHVRHFHLWQNITGFCIPGSASSEHHQILIPSGWVCASRVDLQPSCWMMWGLLPSFHGLFTHQASLVTFFGRLKLQCEQSIN